jgi:hypothetical protein
MFLPIFHPLFTITLLHRGDCSLLGAAPDGQLYVEEVYGVDGWMAQQHYAPDGALLNSVDEQDGANSNIAPLPLPDTIIAPKTGWHTMRLNYAGARHRGMRVSERLADLAQPLSIADKVALAGRLGLQPMQIVGVAESYVLAETELIRPNLFLTCRRIRFAYALPEERRDADGEPYDYDTYVLYAAHLIDLANEEERPISAMLDDLPGLLRPMDCLLVGDRLYVADGGAADRPSCVHVWRVEWRDQPLTPDEKLQKKIYG